MRIIFFENYEIIRIISLKSVKVSNLSKNNFILNLNFNIMKKLSKNLENLIKKNNSFEKKQIIVSFKMRIFPVFFTNSKVYSKTEFFLVFSKVI